MYYPALIKERGTYDTDKEKKRDRERGHKKSLVQYQIISAAINLILQLKPQENETALA